MAWQRVCLVGMTLVLTSSWFALLAYGQITPPLEVSALQAIRRKLGDPLKNLRNWKKGDPCTSNWTGVICKFDTSDGYLHVQELRLLNKNLSGTLAPELGQLSHMTILDFMWNKISGSIPKEIGNITALKNLLLSGNQISGPLPDELGYLPNLNKFQLDLNYISGPIPKSFANLPKVKHFHMNNNSISGQIPPQLASLPLLQHFLLDNNNLSGYLPPELSMMPNLTIFQLDNNDFTGSEIPASYGNMSKLFKLSLRNCNLQGAVPDISRMRNLLYLDLSKNQLTGSIPTDRLSMNITTIDLSYNMLNGSIPHNFSGLSRLQRLSLNNNWLSGFVPTNIWENMTFSQSARLIVDFQNNLLSDISGSLNPPLNVSIKLQGNPVCTNANSQNIVPFCGPENGNNEHPWRPDNSTTATCLPQSCPRRNNFEYAPHSPVSCFCAAPFGVGLTLRSPSFSDIPPYSTQFKQYITTNLGLQLYQLEIDSIMWQVGPRLRMYLKFFPQYSSDSNTFNKSEIQRIADIIATFSIPGTDIFGPYDLLNFTLLGPYSDVFLTPSNGGMRRGALIGIVLGAISSAIAISLAVTLLVLKLHSRCQQKASKHLPTAKVAMKIEGVRGFSFEELEIATTSFSTLIGQGGYGKVYKGILTDGTIVAIKRAQQGSLQGEKEFYTEIEFLSRLHHRNLVSLVGYCEEEGEQMLVYEFMLNGSLHDLLSARYRGTLSFGMRLQIALDAARGLLYLHTEADPPIIHRDIKANNILLDSKFTAKISDFGISKLAPLSDAKEVGSAHISSKVKGTPGYFDPEYFLTHQLTEKSDVYSLGIVFLQLLTGMQPITHGRHIVREVIAACESGSMYSVIDHSIDSYPSDCVKKFMALALRCSQEQTKDRPLMLEVVRELENISSMLPESEETTPELDASTSEVSGSVSSSTCFKSSLYETIDITGSNLVSGVIPAIRPR